MSLGTNRDYKTADRRARKQLAIHKQLMDEFIAKGQSTDEASKSALAVMQGQKHVPEDGPLLKKESIVATAVWLRRIGERVQLLVEIQGEWRVACSEHFAGPFSHIAEARGAYRWPVDAPETESVA